MAHPDPDCCCSVVNLKDLVPTEVSQSQKDQSWVALTDRSLLELHPQRGAACPSEAPEGASPEGLPLPRTYPD